MVSKVTGSRSADSSGIYRRPRLVIKLKRFEDLPTVLSKTKSYPTPIRMVGADYSLTPEMGQISLGALAVTTLPQASHGAGVAQLSSLVTEIKLITPQGKQMIV